MEISFTASTEVRDAIVRIGQTEDAHFSPDARRLALAGLGRNRILIVECAEGYRSGFRALALTGFLEIESTALESPHGLFWVDDGVLAVANRDGRIAIFDLVTRTASRRAKMQPVSSFGADQIDLVATPGSISVSALGMGLVELLVCNNCLHHVSRHLLDQRNGYAVIASEILIEQDLEGPDGVAHSPGGRWIAISNHGHNCVFVFRNDAGLNRARKPQAVLRGLRYPHGLRFSRDGTALIVADSGVPYAYYFRSDAGGWAGEYEPLSSIRVMDDETFERGRRSRFEGGPKGIDIAPDGRLMVTSCEERPLGFFDLGAVVPQSAPFEGPADLPEAERMRGAMLRFFAARRAATVEPAESAMRLREREIFQLVNSRSFRLTAPLRRVAARLRRNGHRVGL